ncbi:hypothetical protein E2C01_027983 [Portunus trituberculatus]|uniref:Uncharacterized protein n=1 Tax=Portunus trituberculatus TaxID=210409 RepID=A0A5B7EMP1_PORTR|nr:hypothetical protein [Portunus trituberculatus]
MMEKNIQLEEIYEDYHVVRAGAEEVSEAVAAEAAVQGESVRRAEMEVVPEDESVVEVMALMLED